MGDIPKSLRQLLAKGLPLNERYHNMVFLASATLNGKETYGQTLRSLMLVKIAYALEMYRNARGHYPATLAALSPAFFKRPPVDPVTGKAPVYIRTSAGYELAQSEARLHSRWAPRVLDFGPSRIIMPPPPPRKWQKGPFP